MSPFAAVVLLGWWALLLYLVPNLLRRARMIRPNFLGEMILTGFGIYLLLALLPAYLGMAVETSRRQVFLTYALVTSGYGILGFMDDKWGDRKYSGLKGHILALVRDRVVTTGLVKAVGGILLALAAAARIGLRAPQDILLAGGIIALTANAFNLLDLRPGRACFVFLTSASLTMVASPAAAPGIAVSLLPVLILYLMDARAKVMLGDTGSNLLGGLLGLALVLAVPATSGRIILLAGLLALHLLAETVSITQLIERNSVLRRLDRFTGVRSARKPR